MKNVAALFVSLFFVCSCALFRAEVLTYPTGLIFPLEQEGELSYQGEIIPPWSRQGDLLYFASSKGRVYAVDTEDRSVVWEYTADSGMAVPLSTGQDSLLAADLDRTLHCLDGEGRVRWKKRLAEPVSGRVVVESGKVFLVVGGDNLVALDEETGEEEWRFRVPEEMVVPPAVWKNRVFLGCGDGRLHILEAGGREMGTWQIGSPPSSPLAVEGDRMYFGTRDRRLLCLDLTRMKEMWSVNTGGAACAVPAVLGNRIFFPCWNGVLYCLNRKNGVILWWNTLPSRTDYRVEVAGEKVAAASHSSRVVAFDIENGEKKGEYTAPAEVRSSVAWVPPHLLVHVYDAESGSGKILFLKKEIKVVLSSSLRSPQKVNREIVFSAQATGFFRPAYTFYQVKLEEVRLPFLPFPLFRRGAREVLQESSPRNTLSWFSAEEGAYLVGVSVEDEKHRRKSEVVYWLQREAARVRLVSSRNSPVPVGEEVEFTISTAGFRNPEVTFSVVRLLRVRTADGLLLFGKAGEKVIRGPSPERACTWAPEEEGFYLVKAAVSDGRVKSSAEQAFAVFGKVEIKKSKEALP